MTFVILFTLSILLIAYVIYIKAFRSYTYKGTEESVCIKRQLGHKRSMKTGSSVENQKDPVINRRL